MLRIKDKQTTEFKTIFLVNMTLEKPSRGKPMKKNLLWSF